MSIVGFVNEINGVSNLEEVETCDFFLKPISVFEVLENSLVLQIFHQMKNSGRLLITSSGRLLQICWVNLWVESEGFYYVGMWLEGAKGLLFSFQDAFRFRMFAFRRAD